MGDRPGIGRERWLANRWRLTLMTDSKTAMQQTNFAATSQTDELAPADFSSEEGALAYANGQLDKLFVAMRYKLEKHIRGWPGEDRELNTHEAIRHLLRDVNFGHSAYVEADYENPAFAKMGATTRINFQQPSADCMYHSVILHSDYRYRITGLRGSAAVFQLGVYSGHACDLIGWTEHCVVNNFDQPEQLSPDSQVEIVLSREKPVELKTALWMELPEGRSELHSRQYYGDWEKENPADLMIRMETQNFPAKVLDRKTAELRFNRLVDLLRVHTDFYRAGVAMHLRHGPEQIDLVSFPGAFVGTSYFPGHFRCQPDQAVIIEVSDPDCRYWNVALYQMQFENLDWWSRASSYNCTQVHKDTDGKVRFVCSWTDPGVPNWLDVSGRVLNLIAFRFWRASRDPLGPKLKTVALTAVHDHLPKDTPAISAEQRHSILERRLVSAYRRRMADF
jgi:hypothetical protein